MELLTQLLNALWAQDFETLANPSMIGMLYFVLFMILFLENGLLPAAFLPGDSLLVLVGVLCAKGAMAGQHANRSELAFASSGTLSPASAPPFP